jgi:uncharacterized membrane protein YfcA
MFISIVLAAALVFLFAGFIKGVIGLGLPTVSMGLLGLIMTPAEAAALVVVPSLATNLWQLASGSHLRSLLARLWPMLLGICLGTAGGFTLVSGIGDEASARALGTVLGLYAAAGLALPRFALPRRAEPVMGPLTGLATGIVTAATGVFVIPAVPYLQAIGLAKEELVQALGLSFTVSTVALATSLALTGTLGAGVAGASLLALIPAAAGMMLGRLVLSRIAPATFRLWFFLGLLALGVHLALRG